MSRLTQIIDYLNIEPNKLNKDYIKENYTHISIDDDLKSIRRKSLSEKRKQKKEPTS